MELNIRLNNQIKSNVRQQINNEEEYHEKK